MHGGHRRDDATVGAASAASAAISPRALEPISSTARLVLGRQPQQRERQAPLVVERALGLEHSQRVASTPAVSSFVVVLPLLPVTATTGIVKRARCQAASRPSARVVSSTSTSGTLAGTSSGSAWTTRQAAPRAAASARKRVAVEAMAADREEGLADAERARVDRHAGDRDAEVAGHQGALGGPHDVLHA